MTNYYDVIGKMENYIVINNFKKFIWKETSLYNFLTYRKKFENYPKLIMMRTYENMAHFKPFRSPQKKFVKVFLAKLLQLCSYGFILLGPHKIFQLKIKKILQKTTLWCKKWISLPCNHFNMVVKFELNC